MFKIKYLCLNEVYILGHVLIFFFCIVSRLENMNIYLSYT
jgi:hypothetical protein